MSSLVLYVYRISYINTYIHTYTHIHIKAGPIDKDMRDWRTEIRREEDTKRMAGAWEAVEEVCMCAYMYVYLCV